VTDGLKAVANVVARPATLVVVVGVVAESPGLTPLANNRGMKIKRPIKAKQIEELENVNFDVNKNSIDASLTAKDTVKNSALKKLKEELKVVRLDRCHL
jgi:hypothetical protein